MTHNSVRSRHLTVTYVVLDLTLAQSKEAIKASYVMCNRSQKWCSYGSTYSTLESTVFRSYIEIQFTGRSGNRPKAKKTTKRKKKSCWVFLPGNEASCWGSCRCQHAVPMLQYYLADTPLNLVLPMPPPGEDEKSVNI